ncbi:regulatory proteasome non-ATPase subunit 5 [Nitzschia inconspicua]|uniref:Regulatory proteasome non-ATPase subunit 5 n=1 Tax=Nitzschia inconspicua TaxID=303405 RepID=A0A9K3PWG0_9STRA|nr:regulatory proteasome non-ATPase subunit 5 [Nitzschia inconspicua]
MSNVGASGRASGGELEEKIDLTPETDAKLEQSSQLAQSGQLKEALAMMAALEKRCRTGNDTANLKRVCEASLQYCKDAGDDELLVTTLQTLATRRSQKSQAIRALVQKCIPWCVKGQFEPLPVPDGHKKARDNLVEALREICDGKLFLEAERARLTRCMAMIMEQEGDIAKAADVLQEVHVETYGSLSKREKVEYILEQMRLTLAKKDYVRAAIVAGKVSRKHLQEENMEEYKVKFFTLMAELHRHEKNAFALAKDYHSIYSTPHILSDEAAWKVALQSTVVFLALSPYSNEQQDMMNRVKEDPNLEKIPSFHKTIQLLLKKEIVKYPMANQGEMESIPSFLEGGQDLASFWHESFHRRIIQHNVRIASLYYKRIHGARLAQLLGLSPDQLEREIASMVSDGTIYAKIDRPKDIVRFAAPKTPESVLSDWGADIDNLLHLVETTTHLINKENMTK